MFNKITTFRIDRNNVEVLDNEFVKTASEILLPEGHNYDPDFVYMKVRAVSAGEYWGCNKNADFFPEEELKKNYKTFFEAHVFKNHENKEVEKAIGDVLDAIWNDEMKYVELFIRVDKRIAPTIARGFEKGFMTDVSMGCKIDYSICSICGNQAKTQGQYCDHIKYERHKVRDDGKKVYEININPRFHDISAVLNGADRTAKMTGLFISGSKVAFNQEETMEKCASTLADALSDDSDMEKEAFVGVGMNVMRTKSGFGIDVGIPYGISANVSFGDDDKSRPVIGFGLTGIYGGASFNNPDGRKDKKKEALEKKLTDEERNRRVQKQASEAFAENFNSLPIFSKTASTKVTKKASEVEKLAEIKKRIKGNVLSVAKTRSELAEKTRIDEAADEIRTGATINPLSDDVIHRFADGINSISDKEEIMAEQVLTSALKMLSLAGVNLSPVEFVRVIRRVAGVPAPKMVRVCPGGIDKAKLMSRFDDKVDLCRRLSRETNLPTIFNVLKSVHGLNLPTMNEAKPALPARVIVHKIASCDDITRPELHGLNIESKVLDVCSEIIEEKSMHLPYLTKRAMKIEEDIEKCASERGQYCMKCTHSSSDRYIQTDRHSFVKADPQDKDGMFLKCLKHGLTKKKEDSCKDFSKKVKTEDIEKQASEKDALMNLAATVAIGSTLIGGKLIKEKIDNKKDEKIRKKLFSLLPSEISDKYYYNSTKHVFFGGGFYNSNLGVSLPEVHITGLTPEKIEALNSIEDLLRMMNLSETSNDILRGKFRKQASESILDHYYDFLVYPKAEKIASEHVLEEIERQAYGVYQNMIANYAKSDDFSADLYKNAHEIGIDSQNMEKCAKNVMKSMNTGLGAYLYGKYQGVKGREGKPQSTLNRTIAENPEASAIGTTLAAKSILDNKDKLMSGAKNLGVKAARAVSKTASENIDYYLGEAIEAVNDDLADIDIFKDSVINTRMALEYSPKQVELIKTASLMYAQGRQDLCDNLLSIEGLGYDSVNNFLQICEDTLYEELEKKASIGKVVGSVVGSATKALGTGIAKATPLAQKAMTGAKSTGGAATTAFNNNATPGMKSAVNKVGTGIKNAKKNIGSMNTGSQVALGSSVVGTGIAVKNELNNKNK